MKWLLVVIIANTPVKTDLAFSSLTECLEAEQKMRQEWAEIFNTALKAKQSKESLNFISNQTASGTCIPKQQ